MKAYLMHRSCDFDAQQKLPPIEKTLRQDLELDRLFAAMACGDEFLFEVARRAILTSLTDLDAIAYRQAILRDCLQQPDFVRNLYDLAVEAIQRERREYYGLFRNSPDAMLRRSRRVLEIFIDILIRLRKIVDERAHKFSSEGFTRLFTMLSDELDDQFFATAKDHLHQLGFHHGTLISAGLSTGDKGTQYVLHRARKQSWWARIGIGDSSSYSFQIPDRDDNGFRALAELRGRGINLVADALARSTDHILSFFTMLRSELGFYVGCLNLYRLLSERGQRICFPIPVAPGEPVLCCQGLYDVCLSLTVGEGQRVVGNDVTADKKSLVVITGANRGGKSTFLRSIGLAQLMTQCGMFVAATSLQADVRNGVFTHFKREEDATMTSGKLDEELRRMSDIVDHLTSNAMLLCNESFASTNEREGAEIARQIIRAALDSNIKVFVVTHMFDLAYGFYSQGNDSAIFLRAHRQADGRRTFRMMEGEPLSTSYGQDLYRHIFGTDLQTTPAYGTPQGSQPIGAADTARPI
jgi:DNA mismatch repair ATPase MutS